MQAHQERKFADQLKKDREKIFGPWYFADKFDLFKEGIIQNTTDKAFESFMEGERQRCEKMG